jgi:hypothetical protein
VTHRRLIVILVAASLLIAALVFNGILFWFLLEREYSARREARVEVLGSLVEDVSGLDRLDASQACVVLEYHLLTQDRALEVYCEEATVVATGDDVLRLEGTLFAPSIDNALFGGGYTTAHCLARTSDGWAVAGQAWDLDDCHFEAEGASPEEQVEQKRRDMAIDHIARVRSAIGSESGAPETCSGLEQAGGQGVTIIDTEVWSPQGVEGFWRGVTSTVAQACQEGREPSQYDLACGMREPWRYVVALAPETKEPPEMVGSDGFTGGRYRARMMIIDMETDAVACARNIELSLEDTEVMARGDWIRNRYHERIKETLCQEVDSMSGGQIALDPFWGCP